LAPVELGAAVWHAFGDEINSRVQAAGGAPLTRLPEHGVTVPGTPVCLARRAEVLRAAPRITVVVCTRDRPELLARCLVAIQRQEYPNFGILVVDNAPSSDATERVVRASRGRADRVDYLVEPRPGASNARNAGIAAAGGEITAWADDDTEADRHWLAEIAGALADHPEADLVSGRIVPAELATRAQVWFEQFGGLSKGRGYRREVFSPASRHRQHPLYPLPAFGSGANFACRPGVGARMGGFDPALGGGTPAAGGEDTLAFMTVLHRGGTVVYQPSAIMRHYHRRDFAGLESQLVGYGSGLTAAYTALVLRRPWTLFTLLRLAPTALRDLLGSDSLRVATIEADFPQEILRANRRGMVRGPLAYVRGRVRHWGLGRTGTRV
jgi:GT2 family glycosyltransferase